MHERRGIIPSLEPGFGGWFLTNEDGCSHGMLNILNLIDDARCFETVRAMRWPQGVTCPHSTTLPKSLKQGHATESAAGTTKNN